jgi:hypothetical protein
MATSCRGEEKRSREKIIGERRKKIENGTKKTRIRTKKTGTFIGERTKKIKNGTKKARI